MTSEEAINHVTCGRILNDKQKDRELRDFLIDSLEKQIPKKPENETYFTNYKNQKKCPSCGDWVILPNGIHMKFCCTCGQAIDWSEV